ncbi:uncharacterized protein LOC107369045 [Tetranychus urticae]|nr:uncharacterized protein LOC107369045 [Tetranychus urticae]
MEKSSLIWIPICFQFLVSNFYLNITSYAFYLESESGSNSSILTIHGSSNDNINDSLELSTDLVSRLDDPLLLNATSDIPIWDSSNIDNEPINETIKTLVDSLDNLTTPVYIDELENSSKAYNFSETTTLTSISSLGTNESLTNSTTISESTITTQPESSEATSTTQATVDLTTTSNPSLVSNGSLVSSINSSHVTYVTKPEIDSNKHLNEGDKPGSVDEEADLLPAPEPGEKQASRVACTMDGDLMCSGSIPTCYGSGKIDCGSESSSVARKRSTGSQRFIDSSSPSPLAPIPGIDQCDVTGEIICNPMVSRSVCSGLAICKADKLEESNMVAYNYWQILLIAGALAIICVTIIVVGIVSYFSWTKYKVRPDNGNEINDSGSKA